MFLFDLFGLILSVRSYGHTLDELVIHTKPWPDQFIIGVLLTANDTYSNYSFFSFAVLFCILISYYFYIYNVLIIWNTYQLGYLKIHVVHKYINNLQFMLQIKIKKVGNVKAGTNVSYLFQTARNHFQ